MEYNENTFQHFLHENIPATLSLGFEIKEFSDNKIEVSAPLKLNINHKQTAFGGSINALLTACCWSMVFKIIKPIDADAHIVIQKSSIEYLQPVNGDLIGVCHAPEKSSIDVFIQSYEKFGKSRIGLKSYILENGVPKAKFSGTFVVFKNN